MDSTLSVILPHSIQTYCPLTTLLLSTELIVSYVTTGINLALFNATTRMNVYSIDANELNGVVGMICLGVLKLVIIHATLA